jgi:hypothetical protein
VKQYPSKKKSILTRNLSLKDVVLVLLLLAAVGWYLQEYDPHSFFGLPVNNGSVALNQVTNKPFISDKTKSEPVSSLQGTNGLLQPDGSAQPLRGARAVSDLSQQRQANGIPRISTNITAYAKRWCPNEDHGPSAGELARNTSSYNQWDTTMTPWDTAPAHQFSMYNPAFTAAGSSTANGESCLGLGKPSINLASPTFYSFASTNGDTLVPTTEIVRNEIPYAPQQFVGIPQGVVTGPQLLVYALGFPGEQFDTKGATGVKALSWSLKANGRTVHGVRMFNFQKAELTIPSSAFSYNDGGVIIPPKLRPNTVYSASILWEGPTGVKQRQTFEFSTGFSPNMTITGQGTTLILNTKSPQPVQLSIGIKSNLVTENIIVSGSSKTISVVYGKVYTFCAYQTPGQGYSTARECTSLSWTGNFPHPTATVVLK